MDNVQWTIKVSALRTIYIVAKGDTFIVNCQLSIVHSLRDDLFRFQISLFLGKHAAAVFLHIEIMLPGEILTGLEIGTEVPVQKFHAVLCSSSFCGFPHQFVVLVGADEQAGGKTVKTALLSLLCCFKQPHFVAFAAAMGNILCHLPDKGAQSVIIFFNQGQFDTFGIAPQAVPPLPVLGKWVDVGVIPKAGHFDFVARQHLNALVGAGGAADVQ